jgi:hypothetical protein
MDNTTGWQIAVLQGLQAHFKQPDGSSKPGTDWAVALRDGEREHRILVRSYIVAVGQDQEVQMVSQFIGELLHEGWTPDEWKGEPGELTLPSGQNPDSPKASPKPWWRFW